MRVYVEADMTVNHNTNVVTLKAGQVVEGPLAVFLVESDCAVTIEHDDRPGATLAAEESHTPGAAPSGDGSEQTLEGPEGSEEQPEAADQEPAEPGTEA